MGQYTVCLLSKLIPINSLSITGIRMGHAISTFNTLTEFTATSAATDVVRLHLARRHLLDTQKTAAGIAYELGYSTPQHFNNAFRKHFGHTPDSIRTPNTP